MSFLKFLKKYSRFTVPPILMLCALLAVVVLYAPDKTPNPKTVYTMPARSPHTPSVVNTGGMPFQTSSNANVSATSSTTHASVEDSTATSHDLASDTDALETCCPEETVLLASADSTTLTPEQVEINQRVRENWEEWKRVHDEHNARVNAHADDILKRYSRLQTAAMKLYRLFNPSAREELRHRALESAASPGDRDIIRDFLDQADSLPATTPEEVRSEFESLDAEINASQTKTRNLIDEYNQIKKMPTH